MTGPILGGIPGDIAESKQDVAELNLCTLIGCVDERGPAWHRRDDLQGDEDNHYPGFIPSADVMRRLFHWSPRRVDVAYLVPVGMDEPVDAAVIIDGEPFRVVPSQQGRKGLLRDDNDYDLGVFMGGAVHPPYATTLLREAERLTGDILGISSAGVVQKGARGWLEFSMPQELHDPTSGFDYRPNLLKADSMDGSISLTTALTITASVCMNTLTWNLLEAKEAGRLFKRKHTSGIIGDLNEERDALGILERVDAEFTSELHAMLAMEVSDDKVIEVLDVIKPIPTDGSKRGQTLADEWRDQWLSVYREDPMASTWKGTAFGVVQADNTFRHHYDDRRNPGRWETNTWRTITGKTAQGDRAIVKALESVLA